MDKKSCPSNRTLCPREVIELKKTKTRCPEGNSSIQTRSGTNRCVLSFIVFYSAVATRIRNVHGRQQIIYFGW